MQYIKHLKEKERILKIIRLMEPEEKKKANKVIVH